MKLKTVISRLEKLRADYIERYGFEPQLNEIEEDGDYAWIRLCKTYKAHGSGGTVFLKPYLSRKIRIRRDVHREDW
jgi:hypothetical protein